MPWSPPRAVVGSDRSKWAIVRNYCGKPQPLPAKAEAPPEGGHGHPHPSALGRVAPMLRRDVYVVDAKSGQVNRDLYGGRPNRRKLLHRTAVPISYRIGSYCGAGRTQPHPSTMGRVAPMLRRHVYAVAAKFGQVNRDVYGRRPNRSRLLWRTIALSPFQLRHRRKHGHGHTRRPVTNRALSPYTCLWPLSLEPGDVNRELYGRQRIGAVVA